MGFAMDLDHVLTISIAAFLIVGFVLPNVAALLMRYETRRHWMLAVLAPFVTAGILFGISAVVQSGS